MSAIATTRTAVRASLILTILLACSNAYEVDHPKFYIPPTVILRKLRPDPTSCLQMTWDLHWDNHRPQSCRGGSCYRPLIRGPVSPNPADTTSFRPCNMAKHESCIKMVIYEDLKQTVPSYVSRYCGVVKTSDGANLSNGCR
jgi:hypothetical protein